MSTPLLVLRADATPRLGAGHAMRCLTIAEHWIEAGGRAQCWGSVDLQFVRHRADLLGVPIVSQPPRKRSLLLVDIYDESERRAFAGEALFKDRVLVDDLGCDVPAGYNAVWNPNAYGRSALYPSFGGEVIAGMDCVPIRGGLPEWAPQAAGAMSSGGGKIPAGLQAALSQIPALLGVPHGWAAGEFAPAEWRRVDQDDVWSDLHKAAWLITAAGTTVWEAAAVGIPVVVVVFADNQALVGEWALQNGVPVIDVRNRIDTSDIAQELAAKVKDARPLPRLRSGARAVARRLLQLLS